MLLPEVGYVRPGSVEEALHVLSQNDGARALAGGQTIINVMKARAAAPDVLVDLADLDDLRTISMTGDGVLELGAMVTYSELMTSLDVGEGRPILAEVAAQVADVQVRNRGTLGGNVCSNDPTNHFPPLLVALGAKLAILGAGGERIVPADDFFLGVYMTAVGPGELLSSIRVERGRADGFASLPIGRDGTCIVSAAASLEGGTARIALGCLEAVPVLLQPSGIDEESVRKAVQAATFEPPSDVHASAEYRRYLAEVLAVRAVAQANERAGS
jgi:aerobic carbon-monoxide dehydrogenase medium subunit